MITGFDKISEEEAEKLLDVPVKFSDILGIVNGVADLLDEQNKIKCPTPDDRPLRCLYSMLNRLETDVTVKILAQGLGFIDIRDARHSVICTLYLLTAPHGTNSCALLTMVATPFIIRVSFLPMQVEQDKELVRNVTQKIKSSCLVDFNFIESTEEATNAEILANMPSPSGVN